MRENENKIRMRPKFYATDGDTGDDGQICGYEIYATNGRVPFTVDKRGHMTVMTGYDIDFEERQSYEFDIAAYDCGKEPRFSHRIPVVVEVEDVNEFAPEFTESQYEIMLHADSLESSLQTVVAIDKDASVLYNEVCRYVIASSSNQIPLEINRQGQFTPTRMLKEGETFKFNVYAEDCGDMRSTKPASVIVRVVAACNDHVSGVPESIFYHALSGRALPFGSMKYQFCPKCPKVQKASATVTLTPKDNKKQPQCSLDKVSLIARRKYCEIRDDSIVLPLKPDIIVDQEHEFPINDDVIEFDGQTSPITIDTELVRSRVPAGKIGFGDQFVAHFWMKRSADPNEKYPQRQHILCYENGSMTNVDISVRGCSLFLDMAVSSGSIVFLSWSVPQLCNGQWHHYVISVEPSTGASKAPVVNLYIDGLVEMNAPSGPGVADFVDKSRFQRNDPLIMMVGGCPSLPASEFLVAQIADLNLQVGQRESLKALRCLSDCKEFLSVTDMSNLKQQMTMSFNADNTQLSIEGPSMDDVIAVVRDVQYSNTHLLPEYGDRELTLQLKATYEPCFLSSNIKMLINLYFFSLFRCTTGEEIVVPRLETALSVSLPYETSLLVGGLHPVFAGVSHFEKPGQGVRLFPDLTLSAKLDFGHSGLPQDAQLTDDIVKLLVHRKLSTLTECVVTLDKDLSSRASDFVLRNEHVVAPVQLADKYGLEIESDPSGQVLIRGSKRAAVYQRVLRQIEYTVEPTTQLENSVSVVRKFSLTCAYDDTRIMSSTYAVELTLGGNGNAGGSGGEISMKNYDYGGNERRITLQRFVESGSAAGIGIALLIIIAVAIICVTLLIFACRKKKPRSSRRRQGRMNGDKNDMEWDNSGFNVVVNPLSGDVEANPNDDEEVLHDSCKTAQLLEIGGENYGYEIGDEELEDDEDDEEDYEEEPFAHDGRLLRQQAVGGCNDPSAARKVIRVPTVLVDEETGQDLI